MYPYIHIGPFSLGTFGLLLWLGAVAATWVLHRNFLRSRVVGDAVSIVAIVTVAGVLGAKLWHELQDIPELRAALHQIALPGWSHPLQVAAGFLHWFQAGFAWFGGLLAGIAFLMLQGRAVHFAPAAPQEPCGPRIGPFRMLDLAAPAAAIGYGIGRIGCLTSGDGDYGIKTHLPWGVHMRPDALVPVYPPDALVQPTPAYELLAALAIFWWLWHISRPGRPRGPLPVGSLTAQYLILSGIARFLVEFVRINPRLYWGMSNAQLAALISVLVGLLALALAHRLQQRWYPADSTSSNPFRPFSLKV